MIINGVEYIDAQMGHDIAVVRVETIAPSETEVVAGNDGAISEDAILGSSSGCTAMEERHASLSLSFSLSISDGAALDPTTRGRQLVRGYLVASSAFCPFLHRHFRH